MCRLDMLRGLARSIVEAEFLGQAGQYQYGVGTVYK